MSSNFYWIPPDKRVKSGEEGRALSALSEEIDILNGFLKYEGRDVPPHDWKIQVGGHQLSPVQAELFYRDMSNYLADQEDGLVIAERLAKELDYDWCHKEVARRRTKTGIYKSILALAEEPADA